MNVLKKVAFIAVLMGMGANQANALRMPGFVTKIGKSSVAASHVILGGAQVVGKCAWNNKLRTTGCTGLVLAALAGLYGVEKKWSPARRSFNYLKGKFAKKGEEAISASA